MSVHAWSRVWATSRHGGTELLMLLAIADFADEDGCAHPSVSTLAKKCRTSPRQANRLLAALRDSGELEIRLNAGEHGQNRYRILFAAMAAAARSPDARVSPDTGVTPDARVTSDAHVSPDMPVTLTPTSATPDTDVPRPLTPMSDKPSLNRQEPSEMPLARLAATRKTPNCPADSIVGLYHEKLPELPRVRLMGDDRKKALKKTWDWVFTSTKTDGSRRATTADEALAWFGSYFARAAANDFLMGRTARSESHANWKCDLDYLLTDRGMKQVIEKTEVAA